MPTPDYDADSSSADTSLGQSSSACPTPSPLSPEQNEHNDLSQSQDQEAMRVESGLSSNNTGAGMAQSQEDSMYLTPAATPEPIHEDFALGDRDKLETMQDELKEGAMTPKILNSQQGLGDNAERQTDVSTSLSPSVLSPQHPNYVHHSTHQPCHNSRNQREDEQQETYLPSPPSSKEDIDMDAVDDALSKGLAPIDLTFDRSTSTKPWTFSEKRLPTKYPSCVFQPFSRYTGTQQSDRQTYNVDVTILTVDVDQCTLTGYLLIRGLTPEHDTLQTYFTGEIIGGPPRFPNEQQPYTFRTSTLAWGAVEKTDLTHWARFPAWRSLSSHAKRDINFAYPLDGGNWWEQENIFMRWKEHFLVPDHKTRSIAGASFEGFYYICLNQIHGNISGIYYHSKSEKYQQLQLKHEGKPDVFTRGVTPVVEFR